MRPLAKAFIITFLVATTVTIVTGHVISGALVAFFGGMITMKAIDG